MRKYSTFRKGGTFVLHTFTAFWLDSQGLGLPVGVENQKKQPLNIQRCLDVKKRHPKLFFTTSGCFLGHVRAPFGWLTGDFRCLFSGGVSGTVPGPLLAPFWMFFEVMSGVILALCLKHCWFVCSLWLLVFALLALSVFYHCLDNLGGAGVVVWECSCDFFLFYYLKRASCSHAKTGFCFRVLFLFLFRVCFWLGF